MINTIRQRIQEILDHHERYVSADVIKDLFIAIPSDETVLTQEIMAYLLEHHYEALTTPKGQSLRERLISTDWRQKEARKWVAEPELLMAPALPNAIARPVPNSFTQSNKVLGAFVILIVSILLWFWNGKLSAIGTGNTFDRTDPNEFIPHTEMSPAVPKEAASQPVSKSAPQKAAMLVNAGGPVTKTNTVSLPTQAVTEQPVTTEGLRPAESPAPERVNPYDMADTRVGDFGLRAARKGNKWGFINPQDQWHIEPVYDDVTPFNNGRATVVLDGQQIIIDRDGVRIREDG